MWFLLHVRLEINGLRFNLLNYQVILPLESERELNMIFFKNKFKGSKNQNWNVIYITSINKLR